MNRAGVGFRLSVVAVACATVVACVRHTAIDRADWGAVTRDATIRVTTLDGQQRTLTGVVVYTDSLMGWSEGTGAQRISAVTPPSRATLV